MRQTHLNNGPLFMRDSAAGAKTQELATGRGVNIWLVFSQDPDAKLLSTAGQQTTKTKH